ncbi:putative beta-amylase [Helianthus annuus]|nr:putative beta-amylase [Helianthus annuus]
MQLWWCRVHSYLIPCSAMMNTYISVLRKLQKQWEFQRGVSHLMVRALIMTNMWIPISFVIVVITMDRMADFFLNWYSQYLIDNGDRVLTKAKLAFGDTLISVKVSRLFHTVIRHLLVVGIYWWYETNGHAAELTVGYYNPVNRDGYAPIASLLKKHEAALNLTCVDLSTVEEQKDFPEAKVDDPEGLVCQVV